MRQRKKSLNNIKRKHGYKYVLNFIDDYSGLTMLYFLKHKFYTLLATMKYLADITLYGHVKCLWTDKGMEFTSEPFQRLLVLDRIKHKQLLILRINMWLLNGHGELYFQLQGVSLLGQNGPKTCGFIYWCLQRILEIVVIIKTQEKPNMKVLSVQNQS